MLKAKTCTCYCTIINNFITGILELIVGGCSCYLFVVTRLNHFLLLFKTLACLVVKWLLYLDLRDTQRHHFKITTLFITDPCKCLKESYNMYVLVTIIFNWSLTVKFHSINLRAAMKRSSNVDVNLNFFSKISLEATKTN